MRLLLLLTLMPTILAAQERQAYSCKTEAGASFYVSLWTATTVEAPTHCVTGLPGLGRLWTCAPDGGWGLTTGEGAHATWRIATKAPADHDGGWFFARVGPTRFVASASEGTRVPLTLEVAGETFWRMTLDLATLEGAVFTESGETGITCAPG